MANPPSNGTDNVGAEAVKPDITQVLPPTLLPAAERRERRCEIYNLSLLAGAEMIFTARVMPEYYLIAEADAGNPFAVCFGPSFQLGNSVPIGSGGFVKLPGVDRQLSIRAGAVGPVTLVVMVLAGVPETVYQHHGA